MAEELEKLEYEDIPRGEADWDVPVNERFSWIKEEWNKLVEKVGSAAYEDTGTGDDEVPTNSEFGGPTPTEIGRGAIVESGSNNNGHYVRWENGEQVCWRTEAITTISTSGADIVGFGFPADFVTSRPISGSYALFEAPLSGASDAYTTTGFIVDRANNRWRFRATDGGKLFDGEEIAMVAWGFWK